MLDFLKNPLNIIFFGFWLRNMMIDKLGNGWAATATFLGLIVQVFIFILIIGFIRWAIKKIKG